MTYKILSFFDKLGDTLPVFGGAGGAISQAPEMSYLPTAQAIVTTIIITILGAVIGYIVKLMLDITFKNYKRKNNL